MNNLVRTMVHEMARRTGTEVGPRHLDLLEFAHAYYEKNRVGPLIPNLRRNLGADKEEVDELFPNGLVSVYTWVGIPIASTNSTCKPLVRLEVDRPRQVFLDHNATTYVRDEVRAVLRDRLADPEAFGNPSSGNFPGQHAYAAVAEARERVARCLGVQPDRITFVGCGSEANNMAIKGVAFRHLGARRHLVTTRIEHPSVLDTMNFLESVGFDVTYLDVEPDGRVSPEAVADALRPETILVAVMAVNNEIGTINPLPLIGEICRGAGVPFFTDAIQAFGKIPLRPQEWGISLLSVSGHKIYAPKGVAALYQEPALSLVPLIHGGGQEAGRRSGTENVDSIVAFGLAAELMARERETEERRLLELRESFLRRLRAVEPGAIVHGSLEHRVPNNLNVGFPGVDSGSLLLSLNQIGIYVSSGSACHAGSAEASHVIRALGTNVEDYGAIRFSFGLRTAQEDLDYLFEHLPVILSMLRQTVAASPD